MPHDPEGPTVPDAGRTGQHPDHSPHSHMEGIPVNDDVDQQVAAVRGILWAIAIGAMIWIVAIVVWRFVQ